MSALKGSDFVWDQTEARPLPDSYGTKRPKLVRQLLRYFLLTRCAGMDEIPGQKHCLSPLRWYQTSRRFTLYSFYFFILLLRIARSHNCRTSLKMQQPRTLWAMSSLALKPLDLAMVLYKGICVGFIERAWHINAVQSDLHMLEEMKPSRESTLIRRNVFRWCWYRRRLRNCMDLWSCGSSMLLAFGERSPARCGSLLSASGKSERVCQDRTRGWLLQGER